MFTSQVKQTVVVNVEKVIERGEKIQDLEERASQFFNNTFTIIYTSSNCINCCIFLCHSFDKRD